MNKATNNRNINRKRVEENDLKYNKSTKKVMRMNNIKSNNVNIVINCSLFNKFILLHFSLLTSCISHFTICCKQIIYSNRIDNNCFMYRQLNIHILIRRLLYLYIYGRNPAFYKKKIYWKVTIF